MLILILASCTTTDGNKATLVLSTPSPYQAKTLLPNIDMTPASYDFTGTRPAGATFSFTDSQPPVMASNLEPGDWTYTADNIIDVTATFSENVTLDDTALLDVTLDTGAVVTITGPAGPAHNI